MGRKSSLVRAHILFVVGAVAGLLLSNLPLQAASLTSTSLSLSDPRTAVTSSYTFDASGFSGGGNTIRCIHLAFNTQADGGGTTPNGLDSTSSTLDSSSLITIGSWTYDDSINGLLVLTNAAGEVPAASGNVVFGGIINGNSEAVAYYGIFETYSDVGCATAVDQAVVAFIYRDGELVSLSLGPTLTFACNAVGTGQTVNGATTSVASTGSGIDFGTMTTASNGLSAHDLEVSSNAAGGYSVYIRQTGNLQATGGSSIVPHGGSNAAPTAFPAAGTEAWGYTTEDSTLSGGSPDRFTSSGGNKWAGFNTFNEEVVFNAAAPIGTETTRVGQQVGIAASTGAGSYQTTIVYTILATY
ncbi:MAG TPA: hypothetical protein VGA08_01815 [Candidatus Saccharimonadales bacterium]